jgi:transcriptional regulator with XRE-family HTH domain
MATLAEKLQRARTKKKLSMAQVARFSLVVKDRRGRITQGYISRLESGKETNPSMLKMRTLSGIYGINPGRLF